MAKVDEVKAAIEEVVPGRQSRGLGRVPKALLMALIAGVAAWASRLEPVRSAARSAVSAVRTRVNSMAGRSDAGSAGTPPAWGSAEAPPESSAPIGSTSSASSGDSASTDASADAPVGIGFDDASSPSPATADAAGIPADSEEGRPAGV